MEKIVLISCASKKLHRPAKAQNLYISPLFQYNLKFAQSFHPDKMFILSAKYGLLHPRKIIKPYEKTLNKMSSPKIKEWAKGVIKQLKRVGDFKKDKFIFLAGEKYRRYLLPYLISFEIPLEGLSIGRQLKYLKEKTRSVK